MGSLLVLPNEFLTGYSAAAGIALINCFGNLGGFVGPFAIGAISNKTGRLQTGLLFVAFSLFTSVALILALRKRTEQQAKRELATAQPSAAAIPSADIE